MAYKEIDYSGLYKQLTKHCENPPEPIIPDIPIHVVKVNENRTITCPECGRELTFEEVQTFNCMCPSCEARYKLDLTDEFTKRCQYRYYNNAF